jgi:diketogulonate reductase-like aldo/keto reductase
MAGRKAGVPEIDLGGGVLIPQVGFGTWRIDPKETQQAVEQALEIGYRHIDTATAYLNEEGVGAALEAAGMADEVFVTTKLPNYLQGYDSTLRAFEDSRERLRIDVVDLYLIHWPCPSRDAYLDTWRAMQRLRDEGAIRAIGVCNFMPEHLERLVAESGEAPCIDQIENHPCYSQPEVTAYCARHGIRLEAYSPLGRGKDLAAEPVIAAARAHGATPAQVVLRWHLQRGTVVIPKSVHAERMRQNLDVCGFELTDAEMDAITALDSPEGTVGHDPRTFEISQDPEESARLLHEKR